MLLLAHGLIMRSEVSVPPVLLWQEMTALGVRVIHEGIIHVLVVGPYALLEAHLLDPVSILQASLQMVYHPKCLPSPRECVARYCCTTVILPSSFLIMFLNSVSAEMHYPIAERLLLIEVSS